MYLQNKIFILKNSLCVIVFYLSNKLSSILAESLHSPAPVHQLPCFHILSRRGRFTHTCFSHAPLLATTLAKYRHDTREESNSLDMHQLLQQDPDIQSTLPIVSCCLPCNTIPRRMERASMCAHAHIMHLCSVVKHAYFNNSVWSQRSFTYKAFTTLLISFLLHNGCLFAIKLE